MFWNWSEGGGQRFSKCSENQNVLKLVRWGGSAIFKMFWKSKSSQLSEGGGGKFKLGKVPKFSRFHILMASLTSLTWLRLEWNGYLSRNGMPPTPFRPEWNGHSIQTGMEWSFHLDWNEMVIPFWQEWNAFHSILARMEWSIPFRPEWNGQSVAYA